MASEKQLIGSDYVMADGTALVTEVIRGREREDDCLDLILQDMIEHDDLAAGLDITRSTSYPDRALLAICTRIGCVLVWFRRSPNFPHCSSLSVKQLLENKDITFFGVHMEEDAKKLRERLSIGIRNIVELSDLAANVLHQPRLRAVGVRRLASEVLLLPFKSRSSSMARVKWVDSDPKPDHIECLTTDAYAAYKIGKKLLGF